MINTFKVGRLYRNPEDHNQVIAITEVLGETIYCYELALPHEQFLTPIGVFLEPEWELIDENERSSETD